MTYESKIDMDTPVGEYLVQCASRPLVRVLMGPGGIARVFPEPWCRPAVEWAGEWLEPADLLIEVGGDWTMTVEYRRGPVTFSMGFVQSVEVVAQAVTLLLPGSPVGAYRIFTKLEQVVVWLTGDGARAARAPLLDTAGGEHRGGGRAHPASDFIFSVSNRGSLTWAGMDPEEGVPGFITEGTVDRIDWITLSEMWKRPLDRS